MGKFPSTRVCLYLHDGRACNGSLYQREVVVDSVKQGQIWVKFDNDLGMDSTAMEDMYIRDANVMSMDIMYPKQSDDCKGLFKQCVCDTCSTHPAKL
jgi:hypothetical protein